MRKKKSSKPSVPTMDLNWHTIFKITSTKRQQELVGDASDLGDLLKGHRKIIHTEPNNGVIILELPGRVSSPNGKNTHNRNNGYFPAYVAALFDYLNRREYEYSTEMINSPLNIPSSSGSYSDKYIVLR